jgi:phospholipid/cholesterol/gamma-HCH transport system permease protein
VRSTVAYDPRKNLTPKGGWVEVLGRQVLGTLTTAGELYSTLRDALLSPFTPGVAARRTVRRIMLMQVLFTGVEAVALVSVMGLLIGATLMIQTRLLAPGQPGEILGKILVTVVLRELAPLTTAIIVSSRSGTAIATELGNMKAHSEVAALSALGIDPPRFIVLPRLVGAALSVLVLMVYFSAVAVVGGYAVSQLIAAPSFTALRAGFAHALVWADLVLFLVKGAGLGVIVGWLCCHYGLQVQSSPTEVPQKASKAVVMALLGCVAYNTATTAAFYWLVGPPIH